METPETFLLGRESARIIMRHVAAMELHLGAILDEVDDKTGRHPITVATLDLMSQMISGLTNPISRSFPEFDPEKDPLREIEER
jgi:hypothetical protein